MNDSQPPVAVVTGAASGIGEACARRLAEAGYTVAALDIDADGAARVAAELSNASRAYPCDVTDTDALFALATQIEADLGPVGTLVTSAGILENASTVMDMDVDLHDRVWRVNYHGTLQTCRAFAPAMAGRGAGAICTVGSIMSLVPSPLPAYTPGKTAVARLTQMLSVELGRSGVRVNGVAPTYVMTPAIQARIDAGVRDPAVFEGTSALKRLVYPEDVADVVAFLCSDAARAVTGVMMPVDAGFCAAVPYQSYAGGMPWDER